MKKLSLLFTFIIVSIYLSSCLNYTQVTTIKVDGSGNMFIHYWMKWKNSRDSLLIENLGIFNQNSVKKEFLSDFVKLTNVEVYKDYSDSTAHTKVELEFNSLENLNKTRAFKGAELSIKDGPDNTKIFSQFIQPIATGFGFESKDFSLTYIYYLPGQILSNNATSISNNELTWKYTLDEIGTGKYITATYRPFKLKETPVWIYYSALFVIIIVIFYLFSKRTK